MNSSRKLRVSLLALRVGVFITMTVWTLDKFVDPGHAKAVFSGLYGVSSIAESQFVFVGIGQAIIVVGFLIGFAKRWSRLAVLLMAAMATLTPLASYLKPWDGANILLFAAWPMLAACFALYLMRDSDTLMSL